MGSSELQPIEMEDDFAPGLKTRPAVHVGSQTMPLFRGDPKEQAWEGLLLAAAFDRDVAVVRDIDPDYLAYWTTLAGPTRVVTLEPVMHFAGFFRGNHGGRRAQCPHDEARVASGSEPPVPSRQ